MLPRLTQAEIDACKRAFDTFDADRSGSIDMAELGEILAHMGQRPGEQALFELVAAVDDDRSGTIGVWAGCGWRRANVRVAAGRGARGARGALEPWGLGGFCRWLGGAGIALQAKHWTVLPILLWWAGYRAPLEGALFKYAY
jgi:hypothetical protein